MPLILLLVFLLSPLYAHAREYKGVVVAVADGDTLTMRAYNNRRMTIRLADIDAPEKKQPYGHEAKQSLADMVQGQPVIVNKKTSDRYQRTVGTVYRTSDDLNVNREQTRLGSSWAYRAYLDDPVMLVLEDAARASQAGLWRLSTEPLPPWQWRHMHKITGKETQ